MTTDERIDLLVKAIEKLSDKLTDEISKINDRLTDEISKINDRLTDEVSKINDRFDRTDNRLEEVKKGIDDRFDSIQDDITIIKADVKRVKSMVQVNRRSESDIINYIENRVDEKIERLKRELGKSA